MKRKIRVLNRADEGSDEEENKDTEDIPDGAYEVSNDIHT